MDSNRLSIVAQLSNQELLAHVKRLAERERGATAALIAHLAELDARRLYLAEGCASLFTYCTQVLHLSEHATYGRIEAARAARRYPILLERAASPRPRTSSSGAGRTTATRPSCTSGGARHHS